MKYSILAAALLAVAVSACDKKEDTTPASSADVVTPDLATPVMPDTAASADTAPAPTAAAPADAAPAETAPTTDAQSVAPVAPATPAADGVAPAAAAQGASLSLDDGKALAKKSGCFACHNIERKIIGPAWNDVGTKYKGDPAAHETLLKWIHTGGTGRWGTAVMPPYSPRVADADIEKLADFILSLPKS